MRNVRIAISQQDILDGQPVSKRYCPVALAAVRALGRDVRVSQDALQIGLTRVKLPGVARTWVSQYDAGTVGAPFQFMVRV